MNTTRRVQPLAGRHALVTGGGRGIGAAIAQALAAQGARITLVGRTRDEAKAELVKHNPQGRLIQPAEVASAVLWLCLPGTESITGQAISVSGGETM